MMESNKFEAPEAFDPLCVSAEGILSTTLGNQIHINKIERLTEKGRRNLLLRCRVNSVDGLPSSFILKKVETKTYDPDEANSGDMRRFFNDWVGSQFLNTLPSKSKHSPHFYGADTSQEFNQLFGLCSVSSQLLDLLHQSWQDVPNLPLYPAFQR
jgi:hypothetical protein